MNLNELIKPPIKKIDNLYFHDDADGTTAAVLLYYVYKVDKVFSPDDFGVWSPIPDPKINYVPPDVAVDMVPQYPQWNGICFDHHQHPPADQRKYTLVWDSVPVSYIIYKMYKEQIPPEQKWKIVVGLVGDGCADEIPPEIWKSQPILLDRTSTVYDKYGQLSFSSFPVYLRLSSLINSACKIPEQWYIAFQVLKNSQTPLDILEDSALIRCKEKVDEEYRMILKKSTPIELPYFRIWKIDTLFKLERTFGWKSEERDKKTTVVINTKTKRLSVRGVLATTLYQELGKQGYAINGHSGFGGGKLTPKQEVNQLIDDIKKIRI